METPRVFQERLSNAITNGAESTKVVSRKKEHDDRCRFLEGIDMIGGGMPLKNLFLDLRQTFKRFL